MQRESISKTGITNHEHSMGNVWEMSLNKLSGSARILQQILVFFNPNKIDEEVLRQGSQRLSDIDIDVKFMANEMDLLDAEKRLLEVGLIDKAEDTGILSLHRLIQTAFMHRLSTDEKTKYFDRVIKILSWGFPDTFSKDVGHQHLSWESSEKCLPHINHAMKQKEEHEIRSADPQELAEVLLCCSWYLYERERYDIARIFLSRSLDNFIDSSSLAFASAVELLGLIDMDTNFQAEALKSFTQAMEIRTKILGPDDPFIAASLTTLGIVHTELGNLEESYSYHNKAIEIRLKAKSDRIGNSYSNMSSLLLRIGKADDAEEMLKRCPSLKDFTDDTFLKTRNPRFSGYFILLTDDKSGY